jgi:hypothetical protein
MIKLFIKEEEEAQLNPAGERSEWYNGILAGRDLRDVEYASSHTCHKMHCFGCLISEKTVDNSARTSQYEVLWLLGLHDL